MMNGNAWENENTAVGDKAWEEQSVHWIQNSHWGDIGQGTKFEQNHPQIDGLKLHRQL